jgi:hypothetical protein
MSEKQELIAMNYARAASLTRVHGILSIVFGSIGLAISLFVILFIGFAITEQNDYQIAGAFVSGFLVFVFGVLPHAYLLFSGITLLREPTPSVAKTLIIINLVVSVLYNLVVLIFSIINLTQFEDYAQGYKQAKEKK